MKRCLLTLSLLAALCAACRPVTEVASPDGRYLFVACNHDSKIAVVDARSMRMLGAVDADSYPVGLAISPDGRRLYATSQGRGGRGGNAVDIFRIDYR